MVSSTDDMDGRKWINKPDILEDVQENPAGYEIKLEKEEANYPCPTS
jgi:hypothetical protein